MMSWMLRLIALGRDPVLFIIFELLFAPAIGLGERALDRSGDRVGVENHPAVDVARGAADRLDQRGLRSQESFLVGIEDRHQPAFRDIEPLAQQIDPDQHVIDAEPELADQLDPLQRLDVASACSGRGGRLVQIFGQVLGHPLGQRRHQRPIPLARGLLRFVDEIVDLVLDRLDLTGGSIRPVGRITCSENTPPVSFISYGPGVADTKIVWGRINSHSAKRKGRLSMQLGRRKPYSASVILRAVIAARHRADLRHRLVAFVDEQQRVVGKIFEQGRRRLARQPAGEEPRSNSRSRRSCRSRRSSRGRNWSAARAAALRAAGLPRSAPSPVRRARA